MGFKIHQAKPGEPSGKVADTDLYLTSDGEVVTEITEGSGFLIAPAGRVIPPEHIEAVESASKSKKAPSNKRRKGAGDK